MCDTLAWMSEWTVNETVSAWQGAGSNQFATPPDPCLIPEYFYRSPGWDRRPPAPSLGTAVILLRVS